ncbi:MAG: sugar-binding transcriptional regulator [Propionibacteriaceae bacterium]|nr:sugar-binding transcriptional regulator [Propionibacteriaceae bacterium]
MLGRTARLYYEHGYTHQQIADTLGLSRVKVTRMLAEARRKGIVEIKIHSDETIFTDLEVALTEKFDLTSAWVAPTVPDRENQLNALGILGATALQAVIDSPMTVAVGLSETVGRIAQHVHLDAPTGALFVAATGNRMGSGEWIQPGEAARSLANAFGGTWQQLPAPMVASNKHSAALLKDEPVVADALAKSRAADVAVFGVGGLLPGSGIIMDEPGSLKLLRRLSDSGAVGNISAGFFDAGGKPVDSPLNERIIGLTLDELEQIPVRVAVAGGRSKEAALAGTLAGGYATVLVTDERNARELLNGH